MVGVTVPEALLPLVGISPLVGVITAPDAFHMVGVTVPEALSPPLFMLAGWC
jgi:hypothetical protein